MTKRKIIRSSRASLSTQFSSRAVVLVDSTRIRSEEQQKCQKVYFKLENAREALNAHESESVPEFRKWIHAKFGKDLTEIRELEQKVAEFQAVIAEVEEECFVDDVPPWTAYSNLMEARARREWAQREAEEEATRKSNERDSREKDRSDYESFDEFQDRSRREAREEESDPGRDEEVLQQLFESLFGSKKQWRDRRETYEDAFDSFKRQFFEEEFRREEGARSEGARSKKQKKDKRRTRIEQDESLPLESRVKEQYRLLARRLHPDLNPGLEPKKIELWHQVQEAYEAGNLARLETLAALSEMFDRSWQNISGIGTLKNLFQELQGALKQLEKKLRLAKRDPSWKFSELRLDPSALAQLDHRMKSDLRADKMELKRAHDQMQALIQSWANPPKRGKRGGAKTRGWGRGGNPFQGGFTFE